MALLAGKNEPPPLILVLLDPARSADPPQNSGRTAAIALITSPDAARVATSFPGANTGSCLSQSAGNDRVCNRVKSVALSGLLAFQLSNFVFHWARCCAPRSFTNRACANTSAGIAKCSSGFKPSATLVALISSSPNAEPCEPAVPCALGAGHAITDFMRIKVGLPVSFFAATIAASSAARSTFPFAAAATSMTCQPYARYRADTSSVNALCVSPSIEMRLSS